MHVGDVEFNIYPALSGEAAPPPPPPPPVLPPPSSSTTNSEKSGGWEALQGPLAALFLDEPAVGPGRSRSRRHKYHLKEESRVQMRVDDVAGIACVDPGGR
jgi:hypothetical protein